MRAVLDVNVLISGLLSREGTPARLLRAWLNGSFELVTSERLLMELGRALAYPKVRSRIAEDQSQAFVRLLEDGAHLHPDRIDPPRRSPDPGDDYLIALAEQTASVLVSGDRHLLSLGSSLPIYSPAAFAELIDEQESGG